MSKTTELIEAAISEPVAKLGYRIVDVEIGKEEGSTVLTVYIAGQKGIGLDDCEAVSHAIDPILDELDPIVEQYYLCVSSPGIDRPLKRTADYIEAIGKQVEIRLYQAVDGKKTFVGVLTEYDEENGIVKIKTEEHKEIAFAKKDITRVKPVVTF